MGGFGKLQATPGPGEYQGSAGCKTSRPNLGGSSGQQQLRRCQRVVDPDMGRRPRGVQASDRPTTSLSPNIADTRKANCGVSSRFPPMSNVMFTSVSLSSAKEM